MKIMNEYNCNKSCDGQGEESMELEQLAQGLVVLFERSLPLFLMYHSTFFPRAVKKFKLLNF